MARKSAAEKRKEELLELKQVLLDEKERILKHLKKIEADAAANLGNIGGDDADLANLELSQRTTTRIGNRERRLLRKIEEALAKFGKGDDTGEYGICELSGEDIPVARLKARPVAQYTVEAKEELERREGGFREHGEEEDFTLEDD